MRAPPLAFVFVLSLASPLLAQEAPPSVDVARAIDTGSVTADASGIAASFPVEFGGAPWLQLVFGRVDLPAGALLRVVSPRDGRVHQLDATSLEQWGRRSAYMNGDALVVEVLAAPGTSGIRVRLERVVVGAPAPQATICGATDDRALSDDRRVARLMPSGCTAWLIQDCNHGFLTAGHCGAGDATATMFRVPASLPNGTAQMSAPEDQYPVDRSSVQGENNGTGADWGYFGCYANSNTGLTAFQREGVAFGLWAPTSVGTSPTLRVTGHGTDSTPPTANAVQQTSTGPWVALVGSRIDHQVDTMGGNSGSPIVHELGGVAIGVHTHGGCGVSSGSNHGTWLGQANLQAALASPLGVLACNGSWSTYCTAKVNSQGCVPAVAASAIPSFSGGPGSCVVTATNVINNQNGIFFYGLTPGATPFQGGTLCVRGAIVRTGIQNAGGNPPPADCSGSYAFDLGARIASGVDPRLVAGATIVGQFWSRDPMSPSYPTGLSGGIRLTIGP